MKKKLANGMLMRQRAKKKKYMFVLWKVYYSVMDFEWI